MPSINIYQCTFRVSGPQTKTDFWLPALVTSLHPSLMDMMILSVLPIPKIACLSRACFRDLSLLFVCPCTWCGLTWPRSCSSPRLKTFVRILPLRQTERRSFTVASSVKCQGFGILGFLPMLQERSETVIPSSESYLCIDYIPNPPFIKLSPSLARNSIIPRWEFSLVQALTHMVTFSFVSTSHTR